MLSIDDSPDFLFFELEASGTEITERGNDAGTPTGTATSAPEPASRYPERRITDLSGSGDYVTVEAVVDSIEWVRKDEPDVPDILGKLRDERSGEVCTFVVSDGVRYPYLEEETVFEFTGVRDHYYEKRDQAQVMITDRTGFEKLGSTTTKVPSGSGGSENSDPSKGSELDSISRSMIGERVFTEHEEDRDSAVGNAKRRARKQGRDPAIDPRFG